MNKILFLVLFFSQIFVFFCGNCVPKNPYYIGNTVDYKIDQSCDYFLIDVNLNGHTGVYFEFTTYNEAISVSTILSNDYEADDSHVLYSLIPVNSIYSKSYFFSSKYDYMRISVQSLTYPTYDRYYYYFKIHTSFTTISSFAAWIIILIVIGAFVCLAVVSMGIAKAMGRNAWEGLACFCIICTLCCCRR